MQGRIALFVAEDLPAKQQFDCGALMRQPPTIAMTAYSLPFGSHHPSGAISCDGARCQQDLEPIDQAQRMGAGWWVLGATQTISTIEIKIKGCVERLSLDWPSIQISL